MASPTFGPNGPDILYYRGTRPNDNDGPRAGAAASSIAAQQRRNRTGAESFRGRRAGVALAGGAAPGFNDPLMDLFMARPPIGDSNGGGGGGGRGYGGGGGGSAGVDPAVRDAYMQMWQNMQADPASAVYDRYEQSLRGMYDPSRINTRFDQAGANVTGAAEAGTARLAPIMADLGSRASTARTGANEAFSAGDARLRALQNEYMSRLSGQNAGLNQVLAGFDAGSIAPTGEQNLQNLFANSRVANSGAQTAYDAGIADRPAVYGGLEADVKSGISRDQTGLMNQLAAQRASELSANDAALQQALGQAGISRMQAEQQRVAEMDKLRAELAAMGIVV